MSYNNWLSAKGIPTIRRLDYVVKGTDNMESGYLYARFRALALRMYNSPELTDERKNAEFEFEKKRIQEKTTGINDWMIAHDREIIFTDINDWRAIGADYDYYWELRTKDQFAEEEARARLGLSNRTPVKLSTVPRMGDNSAELSELVDKYIEMLKRENTSTT